MISLRPVLARAGIDGNPLRRKTDRLEAWTGLALLLMLVVLTPLAAWYTGWESYRHGTRTERIERSTRQQTDARILTAASYRSLPTGTLLKPVAQASWTAPDGTTRSGPIRVTANSHPGSVQRIWTDLAGNIVASPRRQAETVADMAFSAALTALAIVTAVLIVRRVVRSRLDHHRFALWQQEWERIGPQWSGRADPSGPERSSRS